MRSHHPQVLARVAATKLSRNDADRHHVPALRQQQVQNARDVERILLGQDQDPHGGGGLASTSEKASAMVVKGNSERSRRVLTAVERRLR